MPVFRLSRVFGAARDAKAFLHLEVGIARDATVDAGQQNQDEGSNPDRRRVSPEERKKIAEKRRELARMAEKLRVAKREARGPERIEHIKRVKGKKQEIFRLRNDLRGAKDRADGVPEGRAIPRVGEPGVGRLPDFIIIGAPKCGTTFLYHLLVRHPHVEPAAFKELHYFDFLFDEGPEWYRRCFPPPRLRDGRETITGEGTPSYLFHPRVPERVAAVAPQARLIALLRNPVDRTYSAYQHRVRNGQETRTFEEAVQTQSHKLRRGHLSKSIYVDHLLRWSEYFSEGQMLVLKSEDFLDSTLETLQRILGFLDLPAWEPGGSELGNKRNTGGYERRMDPEIRRRLEEFFEPHNRRLYEHLGVDFGW